MVRLWVRQNVFRARRLIDSFPATDRPPPRSGLRVPGSPPCRGGTRSIAISLRLVRGRGVHTPRPCSRRFSDPRRSMILIDVELDVTCRLQQETTPSHAALVYIAASHVVV